MCSLVSCASRSPPRNLQARIPSSPHIADCLVLRRLLREARCDYSAPGPLLEVRSTDVKKKTKRNVPFWLLDAASEMTSFAPSRGDVALDKSGLGPVLYSFATHRDLVFGHTDAPLFVSAQPVLMGFFPVSFQPWLMGSIFARRVLLYVMHLLLTRPQNQDWTFDIVSLLYPQSVRLHSSNRASSIDGTQVDGPGLCSTRQVHHGGCVACVANLLPKTFADLRVQILTTFGSCHPSGKMWTVCEEAYSSSVSPVSCVTERVGDIMPALQAHHAQMRKLRCVATVIVQEPSSSPDLLIVQDCTEQSFGRFSRTSHNTSR